MAGYKRDGDIYHFLLRQLGTVFKKLKRKKLINGKG